MKRQGGKSSTHLGGARSVRKTALVVGLALLAALALSASALAAGPLPGDNGPDDTKVLVYYNNSTPASGAPYGTADAAIMFTAEGAGTYTVWKSHVASLTDGTPVSGDFLFQATSLVCTVDALGNVSGSGCSKDPLYGYVRVVDQGLVNYEEYNYLVVSTNDSVTDPNTDLPSYVVVRAFPPTQTRHGNYTEYTNACTACHGLHSSKTQRLLKGPTITDLCGTCHDGTGSKYDEVRGKVRIGPSWNNAAYAAAGPFGDAMKANSGVTTTSVHNVARATDPNNEFSFDDNLTDGSGAPADKIWMAPGSGFLLETSSAPTANSGDRTYRIVTNNWGSWLACSSCHEPHDRGKNFRLFRPVINDRTNINVRGVTMVDINRTDFSNDRGVWGGGRVDNPVFARAMYTRWLAGGSSVMTFYIAKVEDPAWATNFSKVADFCAVETGWYDLHPSYNPGTNTPQNPDFLTGQSTPSGYRCRVSRDLGGATSFCTACHRTFMWMEAWQAKDPYLDPRGSGQCYDGMGGPNANCPNALGASMTNGDLVAGNGASLTNSLGQHKHPISLPAAHAYEEGRLVDGVLASIGDTCAAGHMGDPAVSGDGDAGYGSECDNVGQGRLVEPIVPLEGTESGKWDAVNGAGYPENILMCVTCHVSHGSGSERNEVAYKNNDLNDTTNATRDSITGYLWNRAITSGDGPTYTQRTDPSGSSFSSPGRGGLARTELGDQRPDLFLPNDSPYWTQYGFSSELARFNPFASVCYRCHSTTPNAAIISY